MILLSSPCHTYPSVVGMGHDLSLLQASNSLRRAWGCGTYSTTPLSKAAAASANSHVVVSSPRRRSAANTQLVHPCRLHTSSLRPLVPPLPRDTQNLCLFLRLVPDVAISSRLVKMITCVGGTVFPCRPRRSNVSFLLGYRIEMGHIHTAGDGGMDHVKTK